MFLLLLLSIVIGTSARPDGAPNTACSSLLPVHSGITAQVTESPFAVSAQKLGDKVSVRIYSPTDEQFEGFILQARSSKDPNEFIDGEFTSSHVSNATNCFNSEKNTLTHVNASPKKEVLTTWTPKNDLNEDIIFRATVALTFAIFWAKIDSPPVQIGSDSASAVEEKPTSLYENCFKSEGCFGLPNGCVQKRNCEILLVHTAIDYGVVFGLHGLLESSRYMAMGFSKDAAMGDDSVTECIRDKSNVIARESWNEGKSNTNTREIAKERYRGSFVNGMTSCLWTEPSVTVYNGESYDLFKKNYYILLATGEVSDSRLRYHSSRTSSNGAVNFTFYKSDVKGFSDATVVHALNESTELHHPSTISDHEVYSTSPYGSFSDKGETTASPSCSSQFRISVILFMLGFFLTTKENLKALL